MQTPVPTKPDSWPARNAWLIALVLGTVGFFLVHPHDGSLSAWFASIEKRLGGDVRREWFAWQQYGQGLAIIIFVLVIWQLDRARRRRLLDVLLAVGLTKLAAQTLKMLIGRPRPRPQYEDATTFLGPFGQYPIAVKGATTGAGEAEGGGWRLVHAWETWRGAGTDLWSMPSSHTMMAVCVSVCLATLYPAIRWIVLGLATLVALGRVMFDAHWPTDVIVGAAAGYAIASVVMRSYAGVRLVDVLWRSVVNRQAQPAYPALRAREEARQG